MIAQYDFRDPVAAFEYFSDIKSFKNIKRVFIWIDWDNSFVEKMKGFRDGKKKLRMEKYIRKEELERFKRIMKLRSSSLIRFGGKKEKERGDFCLVGGVYHDRVFFAYYRSLELSFEMMFDLLLFHEIFKITGIKPKAICLFSPRVFISSRRGRRLYVDKLRKILEVEGR